MSLLTRHAQFYIALRRFPEALRKLDQILEIVPGDIDALVEKAAIAQAEGDLPRAATLLAQVQPAAGDPTAWETLAYQAILERRPAEIISRLKELLAKPDPDAGLSQWRTALLVRLGAGSRRRSHRRSGNLARGPRRTGSLSQRTTGKLVSSE